jgi:hypothetical protein
MSLTSAPAPYSSFSPYANSFPRRAVIFERQEFARHGDLDTVALGVGLALDLHVEVDRRHDAVAEFLLDQRLPGRAVDQHQLVEAVDQRVGAASACRCRGTAPR